MLTELPDPEAEGLALAARYDRATRDYVEFAIPGGLSRDETDRRLWERHLLELEAVDARDALHLHICGYGPVETETGIYKIDGGGRLTFHRTDSLYPGRVPCRN